MGAAEQASLVAQVWPWFWPTVAGTVGAALASFLCVVGERVPQRRSIKGRSVCACGHQLKAWENVPVLGWLAAGGRARCCGDRIPTRYVVLESAAAAASALTVLLGGTLVQVVLGMTIVQGMVLLAAWRR